MKSLAIALIAAAALTAASAQAQELEPPRRFPPSSVRVKLIAGGAAITGIAYGAGFIAASGWPEVPGSSELKIPVVGPWLALAKNGCAPDDKGCSAILYVRGILTVLDGLAQLGGLGIVGEGLFMTTESRAARPRPSISLAIRPVPLVTASGAGFGVAGAF